MARKTLATLLVELEERQKTRGKLRLYEKHVGSVRSRGGADGRLGNPAVPASFKLTLYIQDSSGSTHHTPHLINNKRRWREHANGSV